MVSAAQQSGKASYYSNSLHGRKMSNGEPYDRNRLTCAHRTLPFGTKLRVRNQANGNEVIVEVTDRGPFVRGRIIDLSYAAARQLGTVGAGVGYVQIEILPKDITPPYQSDNSLFDMPDIEYGMAGVCYEFIPEWKEEDRQGDEPRTTDVSPSETGRKEENVAVKPAETAPQKEPLQPSSPAKPQANRQQTQTVQAAKAAPKKDQNNTVRKENQKKEGSKGWTEFFGKLKDWGGSLFE